MKGPWLCAARAAAIAAGPVMASAAYDVAGIVQDSSGNAVPAASVWLSQDRNVRVATANERGRFEFDRLDVGPATIVAFKDGFSVGGLEGQIVGTSNVYVTLFEPDTLTLKVLDPRAAPLAGARVKGLQINDAFFVDVDDLVGHGFPSERSGEDGMLHIPHMPKDGFVRPIVAHRDFAEYRSPTLPVGETVPIRLGDGVKLRGRVRNSAGAGVARARVSVFRATGGGQTEFAEVLTGPEGFYTASVPPGDYYVTARHLDHAIPDARSITCPAGTEEAILDIALLPPHRISGRALTQAGEPLAGVRASYIARGTVFAEAWSDVLGNFRLTVSDGSGTISLSPPRRFCVVGDADIEFETRGAEDLDMGEVRFTPLPEISGTIDPGDNAAKDRVLVSTRNINPPQWAVTDPEGRFSIALEFMPPGGAVELRAEHADRFMRADMEFSIPKAKPLESRLKAFEPDIRAAREGMPNKLGHLVGDPAPEWSCGDWYNLTPPNEPPPSLASLRGKVVVLTFWGGFANIGSSSYPMEELRALYSLLRSSTDMAFVGIHDAGVTVEEAAQYVADARLEFPVGRDAEGSPTFDQYSINVIPQTVLIDREGRLAHFDLDGRLLELIKDLVRRK